MEFLYMQTSSLMLSQIEILKKNQKQRNLKALVAQSMIQTVKKSKCLYESYLLH